MSTHIHYTALQEQHTMELAAISTASIQNTAETVQHRIERANSYWTQAYADVCAAVDREMKERARAEQAENLCVITQKQVERMMDARDAEKILREKAEKELRGILALKNDLQDILEAAEKASGWVAKDEPFVAYIERIRKERDEAQAKFATLEWDINAYRGALGYSVPGDHTGKLTDGTVPQCGLCNSDYRKSLISPEQFAEALDALKHIAAYPIHSEPMGGAMDMQDIATKALETLVNNENTSH